MATVRHDDQKVQITIWAHLAPRRGAEKDDTPRLNDARDTPDDFIENICLGRFHDFFFLPFFALHLLHSACFTNIFEAVGDGDGAVLLADLSHPVGPDRLGQVRSRPGSPIRSSVSKPRRPVGAH